MYSQAARYYHEFYNRMTVDLGIEPSGANIAAAFVNLIVGICRQKEYLQITVSTEYPGDRLSNDVVNFASKKCKGKLIIKHTV